MFQTLTKAANPVLKNSGKQLDSISRTYATCRCINRLKPDIKAEVQSSRRHFGRQCGGVLSQQSIPWSRFEDVAGKHPLPLEVFTEEEKMMEDAVSKFVKEEIQPHVKKMDEDSHMPDFILDVLFKNGVMGIEIPAEYGGAGSSFFSSVIVIKEMARACASIATLVDSQNTLVINSFRNWATQEQKELWYPRLATDTCGAFALSEAQAGSDAFALSTTARQDGDYYVINGGKMWTTNSEHAGVFLVMANAEPKEGYRGITCFLVEKDNPGLTIGPKEDKLGIRASSTCPLFFDNMKVHKSQILGEVGDGYKVAISTLNEGRIAIAALMLGLSEGCFNYAVEYTKERQQFGQPIFNFQAMQHQIADVATKIEAAKLLTYNSARKKELGLPFTKEAAMAKYFSSEVAQVVCSKSVEWLGGVGFTKSLPIEKYYRDCKIGVIYEGTSNIQLNTIAKMIGKEI